MSGSLYIVFEAQKWYLMVELMALESSEGRRYLTEPSTEVKRGRRETLPPEERPLVRGVAVDFDQTKNENRTQFRDDAFWIERTDTGYDLMVSITDVAAAVQHNSEFDKRARRIDGKGAMLRPFDGRDIRDTEIGLTSNGKRLSVTTTIPLDKNFDMVGQPRFQLTQIQLERRGELAHPEVSTILQDPEHELFPMFKDAATAAVNLREKRENNGAIAPSKLPNNVQRTKEGTLELTSYDETILPHMMTEEFMVLTNSAITSYFIENNIPAIFKARRVSDGAPEREDILSDLDSAKDHLSQRRYGERVRDVIDSYFESVYTPFSKMNDLLNEPHTQNTSPMRKYDALVNQRILVASIRGEQHPYKLSDLNNICRRLNTQGRDVNLRELYPGEKILLEVSKGTTKNQRLQKKYQEDLQDSYSADEMRALRLRTAQKMADGNRLVGDERIMWKLMDIEMRLREASETRTVYIRRRNVGPGGERIPVKERRTNGYKKETEIFSSEKSSPCELNIWRLRNFKGTTITIDELIKQKLIEERAREHGVKIKGLGKLGKFKEKVNIVGIQMTEKARDKILKAGGSFEDVPKAPKSERTQKIIEVTTAKAKIKLNKKNGVEKWWE